jgi:hypothetical protein
MNCILLKSGERGGNRTFNLVIKSPSIAGQVIDISRGQLRRVGPKSASSPGIEHESEHSFPFLPEAA